MTTINPANLANSPALSGANKTFAELLTLEFGQCAFLHYGLVKDDGQVNDYPAQQQKFAEKLVHLAAEGTDAALNVLLDGPSLSHVASALTELGNTVTVLNRCIDLVSTSEKSGVRILDSDLDTFNSDQKFDLVIIEGTYHYLQQLSLLSRARQLLNEGGRLLIFGEYLEGRFEIGKIAAAKLE